MPKIKIEEISDWPKSWAGVPEDMEYGKELVEQFKPFINELIETKYSYRTIKRHADNLWMLGGRIIKGLHSDAEKIDTHPALLLTRYIDSWDGPMIHGLTETEQDSFDWTCRKFYKYLVANVLRKTTR